MLAFCGLVFDWFGAVWAIPHWLIFARIGLGMASKRLNKDYMDDGDDEKKEAVNPPPGKGPSFALSNECWNQPQERSYNNE